MIYINEDTEGHEVIMNVCESRVTVTKDDQGPVKFISEDGEELCVTIDEDAGFTIEYLDADDVIHIYSAKEGFFRRTSLKGINRDVIDNVVPITGR